jgi:predicted RNA methylase
MRQKHLAMLLSRVKSHQRPNIRFEAYTLDSESAARILFLAEEIHSDIKDSTVVDLGCGTGILAIGAVLTGAKYVVGIDIDVNAVSLSTKNAEELGAKIDFISGDIKCLLGPFDVALMNPPFGTRIRGADLRFLVKAVEIADTIYSLHKSTEMSRKFISERIVDLGRRVDRIYEVKIQLRRSYDFHRKKTYPVKADLYRIVNF